MTSAHWKTVTRCRCCGSPIDDFLSFGPMPLANELLTDRSQAIRQERFPLTLAFCPTCHLVQLRETVDPERLFKDYVYLSSNSASFVAHAKTIAERLVRERTLGPQSTVLEIASNDGYLLQHYVRLGIPVIGIEPAENIAKIARERGIHSVSEFFSASLASRLISGGIKADVIHANNVLAHVADPVDVVNGIARLLKPSGLAVIEFPYLVDFLENLEFDTVYHEHLCYFGLGPIVRLFAQAGLQVCNVERLRIHGGSLRVFARPASTLPPEASVASLQEKERVLDLGAPETYARFAQSVQDYAPKLQDYISRLRGEGRSVAAYGASAKGATLINYCGIGPELLDFVADVSAIKCGKVMPGTGIPIVSADQLASRRPDYVLLLAWNFAEEIARQQSRYLAAGGRFILPVPIPHLMQDSPTT